MYDIRQFKPTLYFLLILGMTGFAIASESPAIWILSVGGILLNAYLVKVRLFTPLPRFVANAITLVALAYVLLQFRSGATPVLAIGQFLVLLQLVKLFEQRANRDYAQLLVLSLLLMVAASINTASLFYGLILIAYLFVSLYCCLLFHLKVETDTARTALGLDADSASVATLRQDQRSLSSSMRRLTGLVSAVSIVSAVVVFLLFPRGTGAGFLSPLQIKPSQHMTGMSDSVSFQQLAQITQNNQIVGRAWVWKNDQPVNGTELLMLRGSTLDLYTGNSDSKGKFQWLRTSSTRDDSQEIGQGEVVHYPPQSLLNPPAPLTERWRQVIHLDPNGTNLIFALPGIAEFKPVSRTLNLRYGRRDETLRSADPINWRFDYEVTSRNTFSPLAWNYQRQTERWRQNIDPKIAEYARRPEVSGSNQAGPLAAQRKIGDAVSPFDEAIARNIEQYLRTNFTYTLDLSDAGGLKPGEDPLVAFLYRFKRGHCEYFAGAMTAMCQSLGLQARIAIGFKCDDYNAMAGYYILRQSQAHAWVEVLTEKGWMSFDPTSSRADNAALRRNNLLARTKHLLDFLQYKWANSVVAYDSNNRENLLNGIEAKLTQSAISNRGNISRLSQWFGTAQSWFLGSYLLGALMVIMALGILVAIGWFLYERWRLRRRAVNLGLESLPSSVQLRLARQLGFYDDLMRLLERHQITRARHLTPLEFSDSLAYLPADSYDIIRGLTRIFYRIRFGHTQLQPSQQRRLNALLERLAQSLRGQSTTGSE
jgi:transglutaminase-like putative cysteine protease